MAVLFQSAVEDININYSFISKQMLIRLLPKCMLL